MRIVFESSEAARAGVNVVERYGFSAVIDDETLTTDCPALLAAPAILRSIGPEHVARMEVGDSDWRPSAS
jgi:hypothetical protein